MAKRKYNVMLSVSGIRQLRKDLEDYKKNILQERVKKLAKNLANAGVLIARANITRLDAIFKGDLLESIHAKGAGAVFYVVADSEHAVFVEFGTGQVGQSAPYPYPMPEGVEWNYNTGKTIFEISPGNYGWFYPGDDGKWYFTQGMPSRPFMYETAIEMQQKVIKAAQEAFRN